MKRSAILIILTICVAMPNIASSQSHDLRIRYGALRFKSVNAGIGLWAQPINTGSSNRTWMGSFVYSLCYTGRGDVGFSLEYNEVIKYSKRPVDYIQATGWASIFGDEFDLDYLNIYSAQLRYIIPLNRVFDVSLESGISYIHGEISKYTPREMDSGSNFFFGWRSSNYYRSTQLQDVIGLPLRARLEIKHGRFVVSSFTLRTEINPIRSYMGLEYSIRFGYAKKAN